MSHHRYATTAAFTRFQGAQYWWLSRGKLIRVAKGPIRMTIG